MGDPAGATVTLDHRDVAEIMRGERRRPIGAGGESDALMGQFDPRQRRADRVDRAGPGGQRRDQGGEGIGQAHGGVGRRRIAVGPGERLFEPRGGLAVLDHALAAVPRRLRHEIVVQEHEVGPAPAAEAADLPVEAVAGGPVQRAHGPGRGLRDAARHRLAHHPVEAEGEQVVGVAVVGAGADAFPGGAVLGHRADRLGQRVPGSRRRAAAQENPEAGLQEVVGDVGIHRLMGVGDAARGIGRHEIAAVDVARDRATPLQGGAEDGVRPFVPGSHRDEIHLLAEPDRLGPGIEQPGDLLRRQVAARGLELRRRGGHRARHGEEDVERRGAGILQHPFDTVHVEHVADLVAVADDRRGAVDQRGLGVGTGRDHAALDVQVRIDQTRRDQAAGRVVARGGTAVAARRLHRGDASARDPDLAIGQDALGIGGEHPRAGDDEIGLGPPGGDLGEATRHLGQGGDGETVEGLDGHRGLQACAGSRMERAAIVPRPGGVGQPPRPISSRRAERGRRRAPPNPRRAASPDGFASPRRNAS